MTRIVADLGQITAKSSELFARVQDLHALIQTAASRMGELEADFQGHSAQAIQARFVEVKSSLAGAAQGLESIGAELRSAAGRFAQADGASL